MIITKEIFLYFPGVFKFDLDVLVIDMGIFLHCLWFS